MIAGCGQPATKPQAPVPAMKPQETAPKETMAAATPQFPPAGISIRDIKEAPPLMKFTGTPYMNIKLKGYDGTIRIKLDPNAAPQNVSNVYQLAKAGFYDGLIFHRIVKGFMMQGGDPTGSGMGGPPYTVPAELKLKNSRGAMAMARTNNPAKASSSCQFYIMFKDAPFLDEGGYTVIGNVVEGLNIVDKIENVATKMGGDGAMSSPVTPVVMEKVTVEEK
jgi:peptidyl-prolyl cis-trans isomerase B (cyclophilin B)